MSNLKQETALPEASTTTTPATHAEATAPMLLGGVDGHTESPAHLAPNLNKVESVAAPSPDDTAWSIMYGALVNGINASPKTFQLVYPMTGWDWPTSALGYTSAAQYNFCATIPQWSATGAYVSSGATYNGAYQQFLNAIMLNTSDPALQQKINAATNNLTQTTVNYQVAYNQAQAAYIKSVPTNVPVFTDWLGSMAGASYNVALAAATKQMTAAQAVLTALTDQQTTPNIGEAQKAMSDQSYYTMLQDPNLSGFPPVPGWSLSSTSQNWVSQAQGGGANPGSISFSNNSAAYSYANTWAQGSTSVSSFFWKVYANGSWQQASEFYADSSLTCTISFASWGTIGITPSGWYSGTTALQNGPYKQGFSATKQQPGITYMFGEGGVIPCFKTGMLVCYQPTISITVSQSTYQKFQSSWSAAGGIQVGPFQIGGASGGSSLNWSASGSDMTLKVASTSIIPLIFGVNIALQPQ